MNKLRRKNNDVLKKGELPLDEPRNRKRLNRKLVYRILLAAALILGITFLYPMEHVYRPIDVPNVNEIAPRDIRAPFEFPIYKSQQELEQDRQAVIANLKPVVTFDTLVTQMVTQRTEEFFTLVDSVKAQKLGRRSAIAAVQLKYPMLSDSVVASTLNKPDLVKTAVSGVLDTLMDSGLVDNVDALPLQGSGLVTLYSPTRVQTVARDVLFDMARAGNFIDEHVRVLARRDRRLAAAIAAISKLSVSPNLVFDKEKTEENRDAELQAIPKTKGLVFKDELIVRANERMTEAQRDIIASLAKYRLQRLQSQSVVSYVLPPLGRLFFVAFPILFFGFFLYYFRNDIYDSDGHLLVFSILIAGEVLLLDVVVTQEILSVYLVPLTIASMLATILFDEQVGLAFTVSLGLLVGVLAGFKLDIAFVTVIAGTIAGFSVRRVRHRHEFYRPILYLCLTYAGSIYIIESLKLVPTPDVVKHVWLAVANGFLSPILTIGLLPLFETGFGITTDVTLLELSDLNRPLLKRLAIEAPGTYHHSIMIGTLAEDAAEAIGANSLLARVGSYYHDIGKMLKPEYFVENQGGGVNKHEKLSPTMSAMILESHVKEGVDLALKHNLPKTIIDFITGHHGTGVMSYFYDKAKKELGNSADVKDFRYPGPNPRSKEVAIVMLADSVEAASRTLDDPKPSRIRSLVHRIFMDRFDSGLLENSALTLDDLSKIEASFVRVLIAFHHRRIKYPEQKEVTV